MSKQSKKQVIETNGKINDSTQKFVPTTLEAVWGGYNASAKFGTTDEQEYTSKLQEMNRSDLEMESIRAGISIASTYFHVEGGLQRIREALIKEFRAHIMYLNKPENKNANPGKIDAAAAKILAEGR